MRYQSFINKICLAVIAALLLASCNKRPDANEPVVKLVTDNGTTKKANLVIKATPQTIDLIEIKRDSANSTALDKVMNVVIKDNPTLLANYNTANGTNYIALPASSYTADASSPHTGDTWTLTLQPGEVSKSIRITVPNATVLNYNNKYAFAFTIATADANGRISGQQQNGITVVTGINSYSGGYRITGTVYDTMQPGVNIQVLPYWYARLSAIGPNTSYLWDSSYTIGTFHPIINSGAITYFGNLGITLSIDPLTNKITELYNYWGTIGNGGSGPPNYSDPIYARRVVLDPTGINAIDPITHDIRIKYFMYQPLVVPVGPRTRFDEYWKYMGP